MSTINNIFCSVVMPVHNGERFLREAIDSVLDQTFTNFEFLIVENCSSDSSVKIIQSYMDPRIRLIFEDDCGIVQAYNRGFKEAKGEYIVIHDQDDISKKNRIEVQLSYMVKLNIEICGSSFSIINSKSEKIKDIVPPTDIKIIREQLLYDFFTLFNPTLIMKKEVVQNLNYFDLNFPISGDYNFLLSSLEKNVVGNIGDNLLDYRVYKDSTSKRNKVIGKNIDFRLSIYYFEKYMTLFEDTEYVEGRIHYYFGKYFRASWYLAKSMFLNGISCKKFKYLVLSSVFALPMYFLRKSDLFFSRQFIFFVKQKSN